MTKKISNPNLKRRRSARLIAKNGNIENFFEEKSDPLLTGRRVKRKLNPPDENNTIENQEFPINSPINENLATNEIQQESINVLNFEKEANSNITENQDVDVAKDVPKIEQEELLSLEQELLKPFQIAKCDDDSEDEIIFNGPTINQNSIKKYEEFGKENPNDQINNKIDSNNLIAQDNTDEDERDKPKETNPNNKPKKFLGTNLPPNEEEENKNKTTPKFSLKKDATKRSFCASPPKNNPKAEWMFNCTCGVEGKNFSDQQKHIQCNLCHSWLHLKCVAKLEKKTPQEVKFKRIFVCFNCVQNQKVAAYRLSPDRLEEPFTIADENNSKKKQKRVKWWDDV